MSLPRRKLHKPGDDLLTFKESEEQYLERMAFEASHNFKVGDMVFFTAQWLASLPIRLKDNYAENTMAKVIETKTRPEGGPMIRVEVGGVRLNIWKPNEELINAGEAARLLYE